MSELVVGAIAVGALVAYFTVKRSQEPDRVMQVFDGFRAKAELEKLRGYRFEHYEEMADAIAGANRIIQSGSIPHQAQLEKIQSGLSAATGDLLGVTTSAANHDECRKAISSLSRKIERIRSGSS